MAVRIKKSLLSLPIQKQIARELTMVAVDKVQAKRKEVRAYRTDGEYVYLPYRYAGNLVTLPHPNMAREYVKIAAYSINYTLRDYQEEVREYSVEAYAQRGTVVWNLFCSFGKTRMGVFFSALFAQRFGYLTLVIVPPNTKICEGWENTFRTCTDIKHLAVVGKDEITPQTQVLIAMKSALKKLSPEDAQRVGHLILDEADCLVSQICCDGILSITPMFITCCTATYERDDGLHTVMDAIVGKERIRKLVSRPFHVVKIPTPFVPKDYKTGPRGVIWTSVQASLDAIEERNALALRLVQENSTEKILFLTLHTKHARYFHALLREQGEDASLFCGNMKKYTDARILVGTLSKLGRGFDEQAACPDWKGKRLNLLILCASTKKIEQPVGRVLRSTTPVIFHLVDNFKNTKAHYRECEKWYKERGGVIHVRPSTASIIWEDIQKGEESKDSPEQESSEHTHVTPQ